jgi:2-polyprenyl-6-methoxyphenol hydroxylase-like FAD-dependent oxidoreductase
VGAGIAVQPNAMRVLRKLGIGAAVEQAGAIVRRWQVRSPTVRSGHLVADRRSTFSLMAKKQDLALSLDRGTNHDRTTAT